MADGSVSQEELDRLLGIEPLEVVQPPVWIIKSSNVV